VLVVHLADRISAGGRTVAPYNMANPLQIKKYVRQRSFSSNAPLATGARGENRSAQAALAQELVSPGLVFLGERRLRLGAVVKRQIIGCMVIRSIQHFAELEWHIGILSPQRNPDRRQRLA
jgi:hypothetical protein